MFANNNMTPRGSVWARRPPVRARPLCQHSDAMKSSRDLIVGQTVAQKPMPRAKYGLGDWCETLSVGNELCRVVG